MYEGVPPEILSLKAALQPCEVCQRLFIQVGLTLFGGVLKKYAGDRSQ